MSPFELLKVVATVCERLGIRYLTVGSMATIAYGEPRFTNDIDMVLDLQLPQVEAFCNVFSGDDYYLNRAAVESAVRKRLQFNIIHTTAGLKIDCFLSKETPFDASQLARAVRKRIDEDFEAVFASPEDVILKKMEYYRLGESDKHLRDIAGVLKIHGDRTDRLYIEFWCKQLGLTEIWQAILARVGERDG
jgi:hypothetical protein